MLLNKIKYLKKYYNNLFFQRSIKEKLSISKNDVRNSSVENIFFKEITASLKYGWNIFRICNYYYFTEYDWLLYTKPQNEILSVSCYKRHFKMFILYDKAIVPSLFNLCLSSLFQYNLNSSLEKNKCILPTTICQQAPPCHFYHLIPFDVKLPQDCNHFYKTQRSSFICDW